MDCFVIMHIIINMKRILLAALACMLVLQAEAKTIKGTVKGPDSPLAGVIVSDGYRFTKTAKNGSFKINTAKDARFIFVITPSGYVAPFESGAPQFYLPIKGTKRFNFNLQRLGSGDDFSLLAVSDPQVQNEKHLNRFSGRPLGDICGTAAALSAQRPTVGVALGDIAWNKLEYFAEYKKAIAAAGIPFYAVIGNHDHIQNQSDPGASAGFEAAFGPCNYAFFLGHDLVIGLDNILFKASGETDASKSSNSYVEGYSKEVLDFVRGLLALVGKDTHIFIAQHSPVYLDDHYIEGWDEMLALLSGRKVDFLSGHTHTYDVTPLAPGIVDHNPAAVGGAWWATDLCVDGTPRGHEIINRKGAQLDFAWHNIDYPDDVLVQFIGMDKALLHRNSVVALAWEADENWVCTWTEDGTPRGRLPLDRDYSPYYAAEILGVYGGDYSKIPTYKRPAGSRHYYVATPSQYASKVCMTVTAPDGRSWSHEFDLRGSYTDLQAHRGGAGLMPENTISAMRNAINLNVNTLEFDLHISSDGKVLVSHDPYFHARYSTRPDGTVVREGDPKEYLYTMPYDSIALYDVGLKPVKRWPGQQKIAEVKPLASDLIDFAESYARERNRSPLRYNIEIKSVDGEGEGTLWPDYKEFCDICIPLLLSKNLGDRLVVQSFGVRALNYIHEKYPEADLSYLTDTEPDVVEVMKLLNFKPRWWSPNYSVITHNNVAWCHAQGIKVVPWTVDDPEEMRRMAECRVDAVISNYPDRLIEVFR